MYKRLTGPNLGIFLLVHVLVSRKSDYVFDFYKMIQSS